MSGGRKTRRNDTRDPRRSRARALKLLYQADVRGEDPLDLLERVVTDPRAAALLDDLDPEEAAQIGEAIGADHPDADPEHPRLTTARERNTAPIDGFTRSLVTGVSGRRDELDALVQRFARRWAMSRMPAVDRNALRLGAYELQHETTSPAVVINEMVELAKGLSTDDSGRYINGVLEAIRKDLAADAERVETEVVEDLEPPVPDPVALPDDVELVEASTPPIAPDDAEVAPDDAEVGPDDAEVAPDDAEVGIADASASPADDVDEVADGELPAEAPDAHPVDEFRLEHGHSDGADDEGADHEGADAAQQQLF